MKEQNDLYEFVANEVWCHIHGGSRMLSARGWDYFQGNQYGGDEFVWKYPIDEAQGLFVRLMLWVSADHAEIYGMTGVGKSPFIHLTKAGLLQGSEEYTPLNTAEQVRSVIQALQQNREAQEVHLSLQPLFCQDDVLAVLCEEFEFLAVQCDEKAAKRALRAPPFTVHATLTRQQQIALARQQATVNIISQSPSVEEGYCLLQLIVQDTLIASSGNYQQLTEHLLSLMAQPIAEESV